MASLRLTKAAGWIAAGFGVVHTVVAPYDVREVWSRSFADGLWNTFTLHKAVTLAELQRSEALWVSVGSLGVPVLLLGGHILWAAHRGYRVPAWLGWATAAWGSFMVLVLPASPAWALLLIGALLVAGDRRAPRQEHATVHGSHGV